MTNGCTLAMLFVSTKLILSNCSPVYSPSGDNRHDLLRNQPAPVVAFTTIDGERFTTANPGRKIIVLQFATTWNREAETAFVDMVDIAYAPFASMEQVEFILVGNGESEGTIRTFAEIQPYAIHIVADQDRELAEAFRVNYPTQTVVIDPEGNVSFIFQGRNQSKAYQVAEHVAFWLYTLGA